MIKRWKKFNESIPQKLEDFKRDFNELVNSSGEYGDDDEIEYSNTDLLSLVGDLCNTYDMSSSDIKSVMGEVVDIRGLLKILYDETLEMEVGVESDEINWSDLIEDMRRDFGKETSIKTSDFRFIEKWLFYKILNKKIVGDKKWERPM
jgi:hypothetical protein